MFRAIMFAVLIVFFALLVAKLPTAALMFIVIGQAFQIFVPKLVLWAEELDKMMKKNKEDGE